MWPAQSHPKQTRLSGQPQSRTAANPARASKALPRAAAACMAHARVTAINGLITMARTRYSFLHEAEQFVFAADSAAQVAHLRQAQAARDAQEAEYAALPQSVRDATPMASSGHLGQQQYLALADWIRGLPVAQFEVMKRNRRGRMQARILKCASLTIMNVKPNSEIAWSRPYLDIASVCLLSRSVVQLQFQDAHKPPYQLHTKAALGVLEQIETRWNAHRALAKMKLSIDIARQLGSHLYATTPRGRSFMPGAPSFVLPTAAPAAGTGGGSGSGQHNGKRSSSSSAQQPASPTGRKAATVMGGSDTQRLQFAVRNILYNPDCRAGRTRLRYLVQRLPDLCAANLGVPVCTLAVPDGGARIDQSAFIKKLKKKHPRVAQIVQCREELLPSAAHLTGGSGKAVLPFALVAEAPVPRRSVWATTKRFAKRVLSSKPSSARPAADAVERPRSAALAYAGGALHAHVRHDSYMSCRSGPPDMPRTARRPSSTGSAGSSRLSNCSFCSSGSGSGSSSSSSSSSHEEPTDSFKVDHRHTSPQAAPATATGVARMSRPSWSSQGLPSSGSSRRRGRSRSTTTTPDAACADETLQAVRSRSASSSDDRTLALEAEPLRHLPSQPAKPNDAEWSERTAAAERIVKQQRSLRLSMEVSTPQRVQPRAARAQRVRQSLSAGRHSLFRVSQRFKLSQPSRGSASPVRPAGQSESPPSIRARPRSAVGSVAGSPTLAATRARSMSLDLSATPTRATRALSAAGLLVCSPLRPLPAVTNAAVTPPAPTPDAVTIPAVALQTAAATHPPSSPPNATPAPHDAAQQQQQQQPETESPTAFRSYSRDSSSSGACDAESSRTPSRSSSSAEPPVQPAQPAALQLCDLTQRHISALHVHIMSEYASQLQHSAPGLPLEADCASQSRTSQLSLHSVSAVVLREIEMALYMPARDVLVAEVALSVDTVAEAKLVGYCRDMRSWSQAAFSVPQHLQAADDWSGAILELREVERLVLPSDKLRALVATARAICRVYEIVQVHLTGQAAKPLGADDFFPIFAFVVCRAQLRAPMRLCALIHNLAQPQMLGGEAGYYLTVLEAALEHLQTMGCDANLTETWAIVGQPQHQHHRPGRVSLARAPSLQQQHLASE